MAANDHLIVAIVLDDGVCSCLVFSLWSGAMVIPRFALPSLPAAVSLSSLSHFLFVGVNARVAVWDLGARKNTLQVSASDVLSSSSPLVKACLVGDLQIPTLVLANGVCFSFCHDMNAWICVHDGPKHELSEFQGSSIASPDLFGPRAPLASVQAMAASANFAELSAAAANLTGSQSTAEATLSHLESQVLAASQLQSNHEFRYWTQQYAIQLVRLLTEAIEDAGGPKPVERTRLKSLCEFLMGSRGAIEDADVLNKRTVLKDVVLPILSTNPTLKSWVQKYKIELQ